MDSSVLERMAFGSWCSFGAVSESRVLRELPESPGVYAVLLPHAEERRIGSSDIAYVGKATNRHGLRGRVRQYFHPGPTQSTNIQMKARLVERECALRIGFAVSISASAAARLESDLLIRFEGEHGELPPFNRQRALDLGSRRGVPVAAPSLSDGLARGVFRIIGFDEGGVRGTPSNRRLVCLLDGGRKLAVWGRDGARKNIDEILGAGTPCTVECEFRQPDALFAERFGHTHWVPETSGLQLLES